jgi:Peptidase family M23
MPWKSRRPRSSKTVVIMRDGGRASLRLEIPGWALLALRSSAALLLSCAFFTGFHLQAHYGLTGPRMIELGVMSASFERFCWFQQLPAARPGPTRADLERRIARQRAAELGLGTRRAAGLLLAGVIAPQWSDAADGGPASDGRLLWPVRTGVWGRGFGSGQDGYHLAVDIAGERGDEVLAAAPGIVGYAGRELRGYGNLVMLVHPGRRVTLYAHNQRNLVVAGQRVHQGQTIAELGSTGRSMGPHLHFELKHDGHNCDPLPLVHAPRTSPSVERMPQVGSIAWPDGAPRPRQVRCHVRRVHPDGDEAEEPLVGSESQPEGAARPG